MDTCELMQVFNFIRERVENLHYADFSFGNKVKNLEWLVFFCFYDTDISSQIATVALRKTEKVNCYNQNLCQQNISNSAIYTVLIV